MGKQAEEQQKYGERVGQKLIITGFIDIFVLIYVLCSLNFLKRINMSEMIYSGQNQKYRKYKYRK